MKTHCIAALVVLGLIGSAVHAQTVTDLLQQGIYRQETLGDLDGAIQIYKQVIAATQMASEVRAQAQRRLQAAETQRRLAAAPVSTAEGTRPPVSRPLGTFDGRTYRHTWTGITFDVPPGWKVSSTSPSSDYGEMVSLSTPDDKATLNVWLISEESDAASVEYKLDNAPIQKKQMRIGFEGWRIRDGSLQRVTIGGRTRSAARFARRA